MSKINEYPLLDKESEKKMLIKAQNGDKTARDYMILCNIPLVKSIIKGYANKGIEAEDLFQVGTLALIKAIDGFDTERGIKFSGYAYRWIKQHFVRTIQDQSRTIRIPNAVFQNNFNLMVANKKLEQELGSSATEKELAEYTGKTVKEIIDFKTVMIDTCSMNELNNKDGNTELGNTIADKNNCDIAGEITINLTTNQMLEAVKECLGEREFKIFCMYIGLGCREHTGLEIATIFNITKQRVSVIYKKCIMDLKRNHKIRMFKAS